jgi:hypothetical protein
LLRAAVKRNPKKYRRAGAALAYVRKALKQKPERDSTFHRRIVAPVLRSK